MMKKILLLLTCFCCMFLAGGMAFANKVAPLSTYGYFAGAPRFLGGDKNFICIEVYQGYGFYLDRSSLYVEKNGSVTSPSAMAHRNVMKVCIPGKENIQR